MDGSAGLSILCKNLIFTFVLVEFFFYKYSCQKTVGIFFYILERLLYTLSHSKRYFVPFNDNSLLTTFTDKVPGLLPL